jgi:hypothetical protein
MGFSLLLPAIRSVTYVRTRAPSSHLDVETAHAIDRVAFVSIPQRGERDDDDGNCGEPRESVDGKPHEDLL